MEEMPTASVNGLIIGTMWINTWSLKYYSTVTDFARFLGWSTLHPRITAI
jgi:hypothetical protein